MSEKEEEKEEKKKEKKKKKKRKRKKKEKKGCLKLDVDDGATGRKHQDVNASIDPMDVAAGRGFQIKQLLKKHVASSKSSFFFGKKKKKAKNLWCSKIWRPNEIHLVFMQDLESETHKLNQWECCHPRKKKLHKTGKLQQQPHGWIFHILCSRHFAVAASTCSF